MTELAPWLWLAGLGAYHGLNPAMGWLFAVALGLQDQRRSSVIRALGPIAAGHALSIAAIVLLVVLAQRWVDFDLVRAGGAAILVGYGVYKVAAPLSHPRWVAMRVNGRDLVLWSALMSTAHGAGLMLVPVLFRLPTVVSGGGHAAHANELSQAAAAMSGTWWNGELLAVGIHSVAMLAVMALIAVAVFDKVGLAILRRAWFNLDRVWAGALIGAGWITLVS